MTSGLWVPGAATPAEEFVDRVHRRIARFAQERGVEEAAVEVELFGGARFVASSISAEPGFGFVSFETDGSDDAPEALIVPVGTIARIELHSMRQEDPRAGFSVPDGA